jgi:folate-binding protein YgfZ
MELTGKDRLPFLNNLLTNQTWDKAAKTGLAAGQCVYAFFLNTKGRIVADVNVLELGDRTLVETDARLVGTLAKDFEKYRFAEQVKIRSLAGEFHELVIHGPTAEGVLYDACAQSVALPVMGVKVAKLFDVDVTIWRDDPAGVPGYHLIIPMADVPKVWRELLAKYGEAVELGKRRLRPVGWAAFNATRIEAGRAIFGIDFDDSILPAETGQFNRAVSVTKGCYLGQEIVARMYARNQVAKQLVGIRMEDDDLPMAGTHIMDGENNQVGGVTSSTISPVLSGVAIALGYLKKPWFAVGTKVNIPAEGKYRVGEVVETPFVK